MKALLVRIGVDQAYGNWNAPVDPESGRFVYVPIPESRNTSFREGLERRYPEIVTGLEQFCASFSLDLRSNLRFPPALMERSVHLDPDFHELTYGDEGGRRGAGMVGMTGGDVLAFYAGLRPLRPCGHKLLYALVGLYVVDQVVRVQDIPADRWGENAHTRKARWGETDIVVRARSGLSGRLERCIPIGQWRSGAYRVREDLLSAWGGLSVKDGFIQRGAVPPSFLDPARFYEWFRRNDIPLVARNN